MLAIAGLASASASPPPPVATARHAALDAVGDTLSPPDEPWPQDPHVWPRIVHWTTPRYPRAARRAGTRGIVIVRVDVAPSGRVHTIPAARSSIVPAARIAHAPSVGTSACAFG